MPKVDVQRLVVATESPGVPRVHTISNCVEETTQILHGSRQGSEIYIVVQSRVQVYHKYKSVREKGVDDEHLGSARACRLHRPRTLRLAVSVDDHHVATRTDTHAQYHVRKRDRTCRRLPRRRGTRFSSNGIKCPWSIPEGKQRQDEARKWKNGEKTTTLLRIYESGTLNHEGHSNVHLNPEAQMSSQLKPRPAPLAYLIQSEVAKSSEHLVVDQNTRQRRKQKNEVSHRQTSQLRGKESASQTLTQR